MNFDCNFTHGANGYMQHHCIVGYHAQFAKIIRQLLS